jgi:K(+)-stimulated pyrophosphate-energized sodium pump
LLAVPRAGRAPRRGAGRTKNPGVIADCTGDNAGDSVGPTADGFETYGVTGVALIAFLALSLGGAVETQGICGQLIVWIFVIQA